MRSLNFLSAFAFVALIEGCAGIPAPLDEAHEVAAMLAGYEQAAMLKTDAQRREFMAAQAAFERAPTDATRLRLALTMMLPKAPWRDDARLQLLLGGVETAASGQRSARYDFAQLLLRLAVERQRVQRDEQRKADLLSAQLREERLKTEEIQQKLESLRSIDRELHKRRKEP